MSNSHHQRRSTAPGPGEPVRRLPNLPGTNSPFASSSSSASNSSSDTARRPSLPSSVPPSIHSFHPRPQANSSYRPPPSLSDLRTMSNGTRPVDEAFGLPPSAPAYQPIIRPSPSLYSVQNPRHPVLSVDQALGLEGPPNLSLQRRATPLQQRSQPFVYTASPLQGHRTTVPARPDGRVIQVDEALGVSGTEGVPSYEQGRRGSEPARMPPYWQQHSLGKPRIWRKGTVVGRRYFAGL